MIKNFLVLISKIFLCNKKFFKILVIYSNYLFDLYCFSSEILNIVTKNKMYDICSSIAIPIDLSIVVIKNIENLFVYRLTYMQKMCFNDIDNLVLSN